jgi:hypothetical protein
MRSSFAVILLIVLLPALVLVNASTWALRTALDDAAFAATVGRVMDDRDVEDAIADRATTAIIDTLDEAQGRLATVAAVVLRLSGEPTRDQISTALHARILAALDTPGVRAARDDAVEAVHAFVMGAATGENRLVKVEGSQVVLDLGPVVERVAATVDARLPAAGVSAVSADQARIVLADAPTLRTITSAIDVLETLRVVLPLLVLGVIIAILALAHRRARALGVVGVALMVAGAVSIVVAWLGSGIVADIPTDPVAGTVAKGAYDAFAEVLIIQSLLLVAIGAFVALVAWILMRVGRRGGRQPVPGAAGSEAT